MWVLLIVASVGLKVPDNLYSFGSRGSQLPYYEMKTQSSYFLISQIDMGSVKEAKSDLSWIITEPLGGALGGAVGAVVGVGIGKGIDYMLGIIAKNEDYEIGGIVTLTGTMMGMALGIYYIGKWIEKEEGSFRGALLGVIAGTAVSIGITYGAGFPGMQFVLWTPPILGGVIGYRLSLKKEKNEKNR